MMKNIALEWRAVRYPRRQRRTWIYRGDGGVEASRRSGAEGTVDQRRLLAQHGHADAAANMPSLAPAICTQYCPGLAFGKCQQDVGVPGAVQSERLVKVQIA